MGSESRRFPTVASVPGNQLPTGRAGKALHSQTTLHEGGPQMRRKTSGRTKTRDRALVTEAPRGIGSSKAVNLLGVRPCRKIKNQPESARSRGNNTKNKTALEALLWKETRGLTLRQVPPTA